MNSKGWFVLLAVCLALPTGASVAGAQEPFCEQTPWLCTDTIVPYEGHYVGHDEPSLLFYSSIAGAGNNNLYLLTLPQDPPTLPLQNGTGGTFNFQLHPAFWFGMAMCDTQSAPEFTSVCTRDTDANIFDNGNPAAPDFIGHHPGTAFMELQFYPPGWVSNCGSATQWCAALTIDSLNVNLNTGVNNNTDCLNRVGPEPINFAFITKNGSADSNADPLNPSQGAITSNTLFMNSGDVLQVQAVDTPAGVKTLITDFSTGQSGSMTASTANGFAQVVFNPAAATCTSLPYAFHPMYSSSTVHTRVPWAAHSYNVAFSDEIGHFEFCNAISGEGGSCTAQGVNDGGGLDADDTSCFDAAFSTRIAITGCTATESDFDGVPYGLNWPGTLANQTTDAQFHGQPVQFTSPLYFAASGDAPLLNYQQAAFETDLPAIESTCNTGTGSGCVNPPSGAGFYPIFTTNPNSGCSWQLGGNNLPSTTNTFGGTSTAEYGGLASLVYPNGSAFNDFRQILSNNPCNVPPFYQNVPGGALDIGVGANGAVWVIGVDNHTYRFNAGSFQPISGVAARIAVDPAGNAWVVTAAGPIYRFNGSSFVQVPGAALDIGVGADGTVWVIGVDNHTYRFNGSSFQPISGLAARIAVDPAGNAWVVTGSHDIYRFNGSSFVRVTGAAQDVGVGADGAVWVTALNGQLFQFDGATFQPRAGVATQVSVDPFGQPWVVTSGGGIFRGNAF